MSHFTEIPTELKEIDRIKKVLAALNMEFEYTPGKAMVKGFCDSLLPCDIKISTGTPYDIGLKLNDSGQYEFVADWEMLAYYKINPENFCNRITQSYSLDKVIEELKEQGFEIEEQFTDEKGEIQLKVSQWS